MLTPGRRERARRDAAAEWRRQRLAAIRQPSLKSGVITVGSGFGGTGKTDVAVTLAAIYAATRPADRVILADTNDDMPHGYSRLGGAPVERLPRHRRPLSIRGFHHACTEDRIKVYADLRDAVAWLQGVAVIRGDTADECAGADFGEREYLTVLEFLQCMSNIVINDGGTGLFAKLQVGTLLHGDKYVFVTEASQLGFWSIGQVFSRYRHYEGESERPLTEPERKHLNGLMDEATVVVNKFAESDPEQVRWLAQIRESFEGPHVSVVATPWDQSLANRVPLDLGGVAGPTLDAKLAMAEVVLHSVDRAYRRRQGLPEEETEYSGNGERGPAEPPRRLSEPPPPAAAPDSPDAEPDTPYVRIIPAQPAAPSPAAVPDNPDVEPDTPDVRIIPARTESDSTDTEPTILQTATASGRVTTPHRRLRDWMAQYRRPQQTVLDPVFPFLRIKGHGGYGRPSVVSGACPDLRALSCPQDGGARLAVGLGGHERSERLGRPGCAALVIGSGSYGVLYMVAGVCAIIGAAAILPVRRVR